MAQRRDVSLFSFDHISVRTLVFGIIIGTLAAALAIAVYANKGRITGRAEEKLEPSPMEVKITPNPIIANLGDIVTVSVVVKNTEQVRVWPNVRPWIEFSFFVPEEEEPESRLFEGLAPGESYKSYERKYRCAGKGKATAEVHFNDYHYEDSKIRFVHHGLNEKKFTVWCRAPDLVAEIKPFIGKAKVGESVTYKIITSNIGDDIAKPSVTQVELPPYQLEEGAETKIFFNIKELGGTGGTGPPSFQVNSFTVPCKQATGPHLIFTGAIVGYANVGRYKTDPEDPRLQNYIEPVPEGDRYNNTTNAGHECIGLSPKFFGTGD